MSFFKTLFVFTTLPCVLYAFSSQSCKKCHPVIYKEYQSSLHKNSSIFNDPIHNAIWQKHPLKQKNLYKCAQCHTPEATTKTEALEGISCISCHTIKSIEHHTNSNTLTYSKEKRKFYSAQENGQKTQEKSYELSSSFFGLFTKSSGSPYHKIDFSNKLYYNGNLCLGCHSHKTNANHLKICDMNNSIHPNSEQENCISCHMPKVQGSFTTLKESKTHRYHGFSGTTHSPMMLQKYVTIALQKEKNGFNISIKNQANHALLLHPLRLGELHVTLKRANKTIKLPVKFFIRQLGNENGPTPPWLATKIIKDTNIKAKEERTIHFNETLQSGDEIIVELGHRVVNPVIAKKFKLNKKVASFILFKEEHFNVK
jgi:hypothetical protein